MSGQSSGCCVGDLTLSWGLLFNVLSNTVMSMNEYTPFTPVFSVWLVWLACVNLAYPDLLPFLLKWTTLDRYARALCRFLWPFLFLSLVWNPLTQSICWSLHRFLAHEEVLQWMPALTTLASVSLLLGSLYLTGSLADILALRDGEGGNRGIKRVAINDGRHQERLQVVDVTESHTCVYQWDPPCRTTRSGRSYHRGKAK